MTLRPASAAGRRDASPLPMVEGFVVVERENSYVAYLFGP